MSNTKLRIVFITPLVLNLRGVPMLSDPIVITVNAIAESYSRISSVGQSSSYRAKPAPTGVDDAHVNIKHQDVGKDGLRRHLFQAIRLVEATETTPARPVKVNITVECHEEDNTVAKELLRGVEAKLEATSDAVMDAWLWGEH